MDQDARYDDADAFRDALESQGYDCEGYQETWNAAWGDESTSITCQEGHTIGVFADDFEHPEVDSPSELWETMAPFYEGSILWSDNWVIMGESRGLLEHIQDDFGGQLSERVTD